jgi:hypothetical protein
MSASTRDNGSGRGVQTPRNAFGEYSERAFEGDAAALARLTPHPDLASVA